MPDRTCEVLLQCLATQFGAILVHDIWTIPSDPHLPAATQQQIWVRFLALEKSGLVAGVHERLDGPLFALTAMGPQHMEHFGYRFDPASVRKTRELFKRHKVRAQM